MFFTKNLRISKEKQDISMAILQWINKKEDKLNIISIFYNSSVIFLETLLFYTNANKKILYITEEMECDIDIVRHISRHTELKSFVYLKDTNKVQYEKKITICNYEIAIKIQEKFDLVIYDEIRSFPKYSKEQIKGVISNKCKGNGKIITYSIETIFEGNTEFDFPIRDSKIPIIEPRVINTRINIAEDIPLVVYEYLNWSIISNRKVIIYVPDEEKVETVFKYLSNFKEALSNNMFYFVKEKTKIEIAFEFLRKQKGIIVTNDYSEVSLDLRAVDVMVYFADNYKFNYKQLLYLASKVGRDKELKRGEVIFLANSISEDMDKAKNIAREFNKKAWEKGLLNI